MDEAFRGYLSAGRRAGVHYRLAPPARVPAGAAGALLGRAAGSSLEFMDHRQYRPGDDLRRIDWSAFARSDRLIVKLYRQEVCPHLDIVIDGSRSMALAGSAKPAATLGLAALLATAAGNAEYTHCAYLARAGAARLANAASEADRWDGIDFDYRGGLDESFALLPPAWRARSMRVLLSDLLWAGEPLAVLSRMAEAASAVIVVQVLAGADVDPPPHGNCRLVDSESGAVREIFIDEAARRRYRQALARHQQLWHRACRQVGAVMVTLVAEPLLRDWRLEELVAREVLKVV